MFKFDPEATAYLNASNDLMEEIEGRGFDLIDTATDSIWTALNDEWAARQAVLDDGPVGNYHEVVANNRAVLITVLAVGVGIGTVVLARRAVRARNRRHISRVFGRVADQAA